MGAVGGVYALIMIKVLVGKGETPDYLPLFAKYCGSHGDRCGNPCDHYPGK